MKVYRWDLSGRREAKYDWYGEFAELDTDALSRWWVRHMYRHLRRNGTGPIVARGAVWSMVVPNNLKPTVVRVECDVPERVS